MSKNTCFVSVATDFVTIFKPNLLLLCSLIFIHRNIHRHREVVPIITQYILKSITLLYFSSSLLWKDRSEYLDPLQHHFRQVCSLLASFTLVERVVESLYSIGQMIPSGIWKTLPFTILTLGQTSILLPWVLHHVENVFRRAAQSNAAQKIDGIQGGKKC